MEVREKPKLSFSYRINDDGTNETRISHEGMPHKSEAETANCGICYFVRRKLDRIHKEMFHLVLNRGLFEEKRPKSRGVPVATEVEIGHGTTRIDAGPGYTSESPTGGVQPPKPW